MRLGLTLRSTLLCTIAVLACVTSAASAQDASATARAFRSSRAEVVIDVGSAGGRAREGVAIREFVQRCRATFEISDAVVDALVGSSLPPLPVSDTLRGTVALSIQPVASLEPACARVPVAATAAARGVRVSLDAEIAPPSIVAVRFERAGRRLTPVALEAFPLRLLTGAGLAVTPSSWIRVVLDLNDLAVLDQAGAADLFVEAMGADGEVVDRVTVPGAALQAVWRERLVARAAGAAGPQQLYRLPRPRDVRLRRAEEAFAAGALEASIVDAVSRLSGPGLSETDRVFGWAQAGLAFSTAGDEPAARVAFAEALELAPCLDLAPSAPVTARAVLQGLPRPAARCTSQRVGRTLVRAAVAPGFGRPNAEPSSVRSWVVASLIAGSSTLAVLQFRESDRWYREYLAWQYRPSETPPFNALSRLFDRASASQETAVAARAVAVGAYAAQIAWALWSEHQLARRIAMFGRYGGTGQPREMAIVPIGRDGAPGVTVSVAW